MIDSDAIAAIFFLCILIREPLEQKDQHVLALLKKRDMKFPCQYVSVTTGGSFYWTVGSQVHTPPVF